MTLPHFASPMPDYDSNAIQAIGSRYEREERYCNDDECSHADASCPDHPDHDPSPWCQYCGAGERAQCECGPIADNH